MLVVLILPTSMYLERDKGKDTHQSSFLGITKMGAVTPTKIRTGKFYMTSELSVG